MTRLTELNEIQLAMHEYDKKDNPDRHWLTKDSYEKPEFIDMCIYCCEYYEWNKKLFYDVRTNRYYKNQLWGVPE